MPIVVVFTQFDKLVSLVERRLIEEDKSDEEIDRLCVPIAQDEFKELCKDPFEKVIDKLKLPWVITSGLITRIQNSLIVSVDIYIVSSAETTPIDFNRSY